MKYAFFFIIKIALALHLVIYSLKSVFKTGHIDLVIYLWPLLILTKYIIYRFAGEGDLFSILQLCHVSVHQVAKIL